MVAWVQGQSAVEPPSQVLGPLHWPEAHSPPLLQLAPSGFLQSPFTQRVLPLHLGRQLPPLQVSQLLQVVTSTVLQLPLLQTPRTTRLPEQRVEVSQSQQSLLEMQRPSHALVPEGTWQVPPEPVHFSQAPQLSPQQKPSVQRLDWHWPALSQAEPLARLQSGSLLQPSGQEPSASPQRRCDSMQAKVHIAGLPRGSRMVFWSLLQTAWRLLQSAIGSQVSAPSLIPLSQVAMQSPSLSTLQPAGQQESPGRQAVSRPPSAQRAVHSAAEPSSLTLLQPRFGQLVGQEPGGSHTSPFSTTPLPQRAGQSTSEALVHPTGQQPSLLSGSQVDPQTITAGSGPSFDDAGDPASPPVPTRVPPVPLAPPLLPGCAGAPASAVPGSLRGLVQVSRNNAGTRARQAVGRGCDSVIDFPHDNDDPSPCVSHQNRPRHRLFRVDAWCGAGGIARWREKSAVAAPAVNGPAAPGRHTEGMTETDRFDAVVVGASLAGCTAATLLGEAGLRVALVDRNHRRDGYKQVCTHAIQAHASPVLDRLGLTDPLRRAGAVPMDAALWTRWGYVRDRGPRPNGWQVRRETLDPLLRDRARATSGVSWLPAHRVSDLHREGGAVTGVVCQTAAGPRTLRAPLVVGADGRHSRVAQLIAAPARMVDNERFTYFAYFRNVKLAFPGCGQLWLLEPDVAYAFPTDGDRAILTVSPHRSALPAFRADLDGSFRRLLARCPDPPDLTGAERLSGYLGMLDMPNISRPAVHAGVALVGDAAIASDPIWGTVGRRAERRQRPEPAPVLRLRSVGRMGQLERQRLHR